MPQGTLYLLGLGLGTPGYLTLKAKEILQKADKVFLEAYTSLVPEETLEYLRSLANNLELVTRDDCEIENCKKILKELEQGHRVAFVAPGDPMLATTHVNLVLEARVRGHRVEIVPGVSIVSAAFSLAGLQIYKLACVVTFPLDYQRTPSVARKILEAYQASRHSLVLFFYDTQAKLGSRPDQLARFLIEHGMPGDAWIVVLERLGFPDQRVFASKLQLLAKLSGFAHPVTAIVPGKTLHPIEEEYLKSIMLEK